MSVANAQLSLRLRRFRRQAFAASIIDAVITAIITAVVVSAAAMLAGFTPAVPATIAAFGAALFLWRPVRSLGEIAAYLDGQHHLYDLLGSAWGVRDRLDQPWAAHLWAMANARVATLPPAHWPSRFTVRQQACGLAMATAILLMTRLISPSVAVVGDDVSSPGQTAARPTPLIQSVADIHSRPGDSAQSPARWPDPSSTAARDDAPRHSERRNPAAGDDANGPGRADAKRSTTLADLPTSVSAAKPTDIGMGVNGLPAGSQTASAESVSGSSSNVVAQTPANGNEVTAGRTKLTVDRAQGHASTAAPTPAAYRDLVRDFFAR